jgi:TonB family protein
MDSLLKYCLVVLMICFASCGSSGKTFDFEKYRADIQAYDLDAVDKEPEIRGGMFELVKDIDYPEEARKERAEGLVVIGFIVDKNGDPHNFEVLKSVGYGCDEEALRAVSSVTFIPAMKNGEPVNVHFQAPISFRLP